MKKSTSILIICVGAILAIVACLKLFVMWGIIPLGEESMQHFFALLEPYFAPVLILVIGIMFIVKGIKKE